MKVNAYEIFIYNTDVRGYLPVSQMGHVAMLHSNSIKSLIININSLVFRLNGSTTIASAFTMSEERSSLQ